MITWYENSTVLQSRLKCNNEDFARYTSEKKKQKEKKKVFCETACKKRVVSHRQCAVALCLHAVSQLNMLVQHGSAAKHLLTLSTEPVDAHTKTTLIKQ